VEEHPKLGTKYFPTGTSMCTQVWDDNDPATTSNMIYQWENFCANPKNKNIQEIRDRWAAHQIEMQALGDEFEERLGKGPDQSSL